MLRIPSQSTEGAIETDTVDDGKPISMGSPLTNALRQDSQEVSNQRERSKSTRRIALNGRSLGLLILANPARPAWFPPLGSCLTR
jgi:hypothetical protein